MKVFYSNVSTSETMFCWIDNKIQGMILIKQHPKDTSLWTVEFVRSIKPKLGPKIYDCAMQFIGKEYNGWLTSSRDSVSIKAINVWDYYFNNRSDIIKQTLEDKETHNLRKGEDYKFLNWKYQQCLLETVPIAVPSDSDEIKQGYELFNRWKP